MADDGRGCDPEDFDWPLVLLLEDPKYIVHAALDRAWKLELSCEPMRAIAVLRQALDAIGPEPSAARMRIAIGRELILRQRAEKDLNGAMWTVARLLLAHGGNDWAWPWAMDLMRALDEAGFEDAPLCRWWHQLETAYESRESISWDALDQLTLDGTGWDD